MEQEAAYLIPERTGCAAPPSGRILRDLNIVTAADDAPHASGCRPDRTVAVYQDGKGDSQIGDGFLYVRRIFLKVELRRMDADDNQAGILVLCRPRSDVGKLAQAIYARVSPEIDQHALAA